MPACRCMGVQLRDLNARTHLRDATVRPLRSPAFVPLRLSVAFTIEMYYRLFTENLAACCSPSGAGSAAASVLSAVLCKHLILNQSSFNSADAGKGEGLGGPKLARTGSSHAQGTGVVLQEEHCHLSTCTVDSS